MGQVRYTKCVADTNRPDRVYGNVDEIEPLYGNETSMVTSAHAPCVAHAPKSTKIIMAMHAFLPTIYK